MQKKCYDAYFRPRGYSFTNVLKSIDTALAYDKFVAINYLNCPGFSYTPRKFDTLFRFLEKHPIYMIQWRNLNFEPIRYWRAMNAVSRHGEPMGMESVLKRVRRLFPNLKFGYFDPPKETFS